MRKKRLDYGGTVNPQYINPIQSNSLTGKLQTTLPNMGMQGNLTKAGQLDTARFNTTPTPKKGMNMGTAGTIAGVAGSAMEGSAVQNAISQAGPWGAIIGTASKIGTSIGEGIGGDVGGAITGAFDPSRVLMDENLSVGKRIIGAGVPILGGIWSSRAKKKKIAEQKRKVADANMQQDAAMRTSQMVSQDLTPDVQVMAGGGKILEYGGPTHEESPIGGIPVDSNGNLTSLNNAKALVEDKEVAWNKGKNDTYVFSDRLGFAKEAKDIMNKYKKRLGKDLKGSDAITRNSMDKELSNLENAQEQIKKVITSTNNLQMANGGVVPKEVTPSSYMYPETSEKFNQFKADVESSERAKDFARLYHYKQVLDPLLASKDKKGFESYTKDIPANLKDRVKKADEAYKSGYAGYLNVPEMQQALGDKYDDYVKLMNKLSKPELGIAGTNEQGQPVQAMKYGLRSSLSITPYQNIMINKAPDNTKTKSQFGVQVFYNPDKNAYDYKYEQPKEFKCGGKIPKMDIGGNIPYRNVIPFNTMTPSENIDYLGRKVVKPMKSLEYKSQEPKGIGSYMPTSNANKKSTENKTYLGDIVPIAGSTALSMAGTAYALKNLKKPKPIKVNRITPSTINLESARESARTSAKEGMAGIRSAAKSVSSPNYMNEVIAGNIGTQRELGKILTQSYLAEQTANAAAKDEAARANLAAELQAQGIDTARLDNYADTKAALTSNLFTLPAIGVSEYLKNKNVLDAAQMNSPYEITTSPTSRWKRQFRIKKEGK